MKQAPNEEMMALFPAEQALVLDLQIKSSYNDTPDAYILLASSQFLGEQYERQRGRDQSNP